MKTFTKSFFTYIFLCLAISGFTAARASHTLPAVVVSVAEQGDNLVSIYPNPNKGIAKIQINQPVDGSYKIRFSNTIGKVVKVVDLSSLTEGNEVSLDLTSLPSGVYFYSIVINDKLMETKRMILEH